MRVKYQNKIVYNILAWFSESVKSILVTTHGAQTLLNHYFQYQVMIRHGIGTATTTSNKLLKLTAIGVGNPFVTIQPFVHVL